MKAQYDVAIFGGGLYGCQTASFLSKRGKKVVLIEKEKALLQRASKWNQARVHHGYHYPRHTQTAHSSALNYAKFIRDFEECIFDDFNHVYAIPRLNSNVRASQFVRLMQRIGLETKLAGPGIRKNFNPEVFDEIFEVSEVIFDAELLRRKIENDLYNSGVTIVLNAQITNIQYLNKEEKPVWNLNVLDGENEINASLLFNCTYAGINSVLGKINLDPIPLRFELTEMALVDVPDEFRKLGITVMDGPFFSILPFPIKKLFSVSHVRYTPHCEWDLNIANADAILKTPPNSKFAFMSKDIQKFLPFFSEYLYKESFWEYKTILPKNSDNDGRPILAHRHPQNPNLISLMGGKIDNFYDLEMFLKTCIE